MFMQNSQNKRLNEIFRKFCAFASAKGLSQERKIKHTNRAIDLLRLFQEFEYNKTELEEFQKKMFNEGIKTSSQMFIGMAIAMQDISDNLKKGKGNEDAKIFYDKIEATIKGLEQRKERLSTATAENTNSQESVSKHATPGRFFSPHSTNPPPTKRAKHEEKIDNEEQEAPDIDTIQNQKIES